MHILTSAVLVALATPAAAHGGWGIFDGVAGDGKVVTEGREVPPFESVRLEAPLGVQVKVGPSRSVKVTIDGNLQPLVAARVESGVLVVTAERPFRESREGRVEISVPELRELVVRGSGDAAIEGGAGALALQVDGSGDLRWRGEATTLRAVVEGSGDVRLEGRAALLQARVRGSGDVTAGRLEAADVEAKVEGSGDVDVNVAGGRLEAVVEGSGDIRWRGEARTESIVVRGSGDVEHVPARR